MLFSMLVLPAYAATINQIKLNAGKIEVSGTSSEEKISYKVYNSSLSGTSIDDICEMGEAEVSDGKFSITFKMPKTMGGVETDGDYIIQVKDSAKTSKNFLFAGYSYRAAFLADLNTKTTGLEIYNLFECKSADNKYDNTDIMKNLGVDIDYYNALTVVEKNKIASAFLTKKGTTIVTQDNFSEIFNEAKARACRSVKIDILNANMNVGENFTAEIKTYLGNRYNYLLSEIKFSKDLILKSINPIDFKYAEQDGKIEEYEDYKYLTVISQHSDEDYAEAYKVYTPFSLEFELNKYCPLDSVSITHTENSLAIGDEEYPLPAATAEFEVIPKLADSIAITQNETENGTYSFSAEILPDYTRNKTVLWSVNDESIATISQEGVLNVLKNGTVTVTARTADGSELSDSKTIGVVAKSAVETITILQGTQISNKILFTATVLPETAQNKNVIWSVSDESIATISQDGLLTMVKSGKITVTATAEDGFGATASKTINAVNPLIATGVVISQGEQVSNKIQFTATVLPKTAQNKNVIWSVSDESTATISQDGLLTILQNGTVVVTATAQDGFGAVSSKTVTFTLPITVNSLSSSIGAWDKAFELYVYDYTVYVPKDTDTISFNGSWDSGTTKCNGSLMIKGRDKQVSLTEDETFVTISRTGVTGYLDSEYNINVVRIDDLSFVSPYEILGSSIKFNIATLILDGDNEYSLFAAGYDSNKKLVSLSKVSAESGYNEVIIDLDNANDATNYKIMLLTDDLMPYTKALEGNIVR